MFFEKNEVIELGSGTKYIVVDLLKYENEYYYYVCEINSDETKIVDNYKIIKTVIDKGNLFVKTVKNDLFEKVLLMFKERLELK